MNKCTRFSARASLAAFGLNMRRLKVWEVMEEGVDIKQKTIRHSPLEKLKDALINILSGGQGLVEINSRVRPDQMVQAAFGRAGCADQSTVSETLNACTQETVKQMKAALQTIYQTHSQGYQHDYDKNDQLLDIDMTGMPTGRQGEGVTKGYFAGQKNRRGRQLGRVTATRYDEIVIDQLYEGKRQLDANLHELVEAAEQVLALDEERRAQTILRVDGGGGSTSDINWMLKRGYLVLVKAKSWQRAASLCRSVNHWIPDPKVAGRECGWVTDPYSYDRSTRQLGIRCRKKDGSWSFHVLVFNLSDQALFRLGRQPIRRHYSPDQLLLAALYAYDLRSGGIETINKNCKQGLGLTKRNKKLFPAQMILILLAQLAYNLISWTRLDMVHNVPDFHQLGTLRFVRDVLSIPGRFELDAQGHLLIVLNQRHPWAASFVSAFSSLLALDDLSLILGQI
jgi:hypothetical protein